MLGNTQLYSSFMVGPFHFSEIMIKLAKNEKENYWINKMRKKITESQRARRGRVLVGVDR